MGGREHSRFQIFERVAYTATQNSSVFETVGCRGLLLLLDVDGTVGAKTLDVKVQAEVDLGGDFYDIDGAAFAQKSGAGQDVLELYPGLTESANKKVSVVLPSRWRVVATVAGAGTSITFKLVGEVLW